MYFCRQFQNSQKFFCDDQPQSPLNLEHRNSPLNLSPSVQNLSLKNISNYRKKFPDNQMNVIHEKNTLDNSQSDSNFYCDNINRGINMKKSNGISKQTNLFSCNIPEKKNNISNNIYTESEITNGNFPSKSNEVKSYNTNVTNSTSKYISHKMQQLSNVNGFGEKNIENSYDCPDEEVNYTQNDLNINSHAQSSQSLINSPSVQNQSYLENPSSNFTSARENLFISNSGSNDYAEVEPISLSTDSFYKISDEKNIGELLEIHSENLKKCNVLQGRIGKNLKQPILSKDHSQTLSNNQVENKGNSNCSKGKYRNMTKNDLSGNKDSEERKNLLCSNFNITTAIKDVIISKSNKSYEPEQKGNVLNGDMKKDLEYKKDTKIEKVVKNYKCDICGIVVSYASALKRHKYIHTGNKTHTCHICKKSFYQRCDLLRHAKVHSTQNKKPSKLTCEPEKKFICSICNNALSTKCEWGLHMWKHTKDAKYIIPISDKSQDI